MIRIKDVNKKGDAVEQYKIKILTHYDHSLNAIADLRRSPTARYFLVAKLVRPQANSIPQVAHQII